MTEAQIVIRLIDKFSADLDSIKKSIASFGENATRSIRNTQTQFSSFSKTVASSALSFVKSMALMAAATFGLQKGITTLMDFDDARARVVGLAGLKGNDVNKLTASALKIGGSTEFSGTDVMSAFAITARTIKDVKEIEAITKVQTNLASLGQTTITDIAQNSTALVGILGLNSKNIQNFGDTVAQMSTKNSASITSNLEAMTIAIPMMQAYGQTFKDTAAILSVAPKSTGLAGSELGTALRSMVTGLNQTVRLARSGSPRDSLALRQLGLTPDQLDLTKRKLVDVLATIKAARNRDGSTVNGVQLNTILGDYGQVLGTGLIRDIDKIKEARVELDNVKGKLGEMSAPMRATLRASVGNAIGAVESLIVKLGDSGLTAAIIGAAKAFENFFNFLANNPAIVDAIVYFTKIGFAILSVVAAVKVAGMIFGFVKALQISLLGFAATTRLAFAAHPIMAMVASIMLAIEAVKYLKYLWNSFTGEGSTPQADGSKSTPKNGAFWQGGDGKMTPYTPQSKQTVQSDININISGLPKGVTVDAQQRGASGMNVGTTNISYAGIVGSLF